MLVDVIVLNCSRVSHIFLQIVIHPDVINDVAHSVPLQVRGLTTTTHQAVNVSYKYTYRGAQNSFNLNPNYLRFFEN